MKVSFSPAKLSKTATLAICVSADRQLGTQGKAVDKATGSLLTRAMKDSRFSGKAGQFKLVHTHMGSDYDHVILVGLGIAKDFDALAAQKAGAAIAKGLDDNGFKQASILVELPKGSKLPEGEVAANMAFGAMLKSYRFDKYRTTQKEEQKASLEKLAFLTADPKGAQNQFAILSHITDGIFFTRNLVSEPANIIHPESLAEKCKELKTLGVDVQVLGEKEMKKLGMGALLGVGQGSDKESQLVVMQWNGAAKKDKPLAIIGKGVTFDSGGVSIKPANGMEEMKWDMGGSAVVIGLMRTLANRKAKVNVVGVVGLVENMISGNAQRPGDVVTSMSGQTIEVINTDAEGRLVLADALWYTQDRFKPQFMIDLATLTGAIIVALGKRRAGLFTNNDGLAAKLMAAGDTEGERVWRLPIGDEYEAHIESDIADMKNVGRPGQAGSISAAQFLERFVNKTPWAHLDIAGTTWTNEDLDFARKGATGFGVRLLNRFIKDNYEK